MQNNALRWINGLPPFDQTKIKLLLSDTGLDSLEHRRRDARVTMLYKMVHGLVNISTEELGLEPADQRTRASHRHKFKDRGGRSNQIKFSFASRTVPDWNALPAIVAEAGSLDLFKSRLAQARHP